MGKALIIKDADFSINGIPAEFTRLSWIGGSTQNNQYINSGLFWGNKVDDLDDGIEFKFKLDDTSVTSDPVNFFSIGANINSNTYLCAWFRADATTIRFGNTSLTLSGIMLFDNNWHTLLINKYGCVLDNVEYNFTTPPTPYEGDNPSTVYGDIPIYLDCASRRGSNNEKNYYIEGPSSAMKMAWVKYYREESVILDAIPVKRRADNAICFYERVSGAYLLRNDGSTPAYEL